MTDDVNGWVSSADAWIASIGEEGDWTRKTFLDAAMLERVKARIKEGFSILAVGKGVLFESFRNWASVVSVSIRSKS